MSFTSDVKEELSKMPNLAKKDQVRMELIGYLISTNTYISGKKVKFSTENEYNINRFSKVLRNMGVESHKIDIKRKVFSIDFKYDLATLELDVLEDKIILAEQERNELLDKALVRGAFLGGGYVNNPENKYHLEINLQSENNLKYIQKILEFYGIGTKTLNKENTCTLYAKEGEEISKVLAFIGANNAVLKFEETRVLRETSNNLNRIVNCETANFSKTINAGKKQIEDIKFLKQKHRYSELPDSLKIVAELRLKYPEASLVELVNIMDNTISKSGISHRLAAISKIAKELREE